jgi:hypothetical protein
MEERYKKFLDTDYPLLERFRQVAPGSFRHSQNVSSICESIAIDLDLDIDLMRVAGLYHDIGKMNYPLNFSENQSSNENIHDSIEPKMSYHLITRHVSDTVMILMQHEFPRDVIQIISEHHGDTILRQFHRKDPDAPEDNYRYKGNKPSSTESVVLMLSDSVEATTRAAFLKREEDESNGNFIRRSVQRTIDRLDEDDQLDNTLHGTIKRVKRILVKELESVYHKRVTYDPDNEDDKVE